MTEQRAPLGLPFMKMHGLGNDFVVIDARYGDDPVTPALARALGDRNRGVGFDQLAVILPAQGADFRIKFWNSDGTEAGACGNATRCVSDYMMAQMGVNEVTLITQRGQLSAVRRADGMVSVNMGAPILDAPLIPVNGDPMALPLAGDPVAVGMGNPHCVFFVEDADFISLTGGVAESRKQIEEIFAGELAGAFARARLVTGKTRVRPLGKHVAVVTQRFVLSGLVHADGADAGRIGAVFAATMAQTNNGWRIVSAQFVVEP